MSESALDEMYRLDLSLTCLYVIDREQFNQYNADAVRLIGLQTRYKSLRTPWLSMWRHPGDACAKMREQLQQHEDARRSTRAREDVYDFSQHDATDEQLHRLRVAIKRMCG